MLRKLLVLLLAAGLAALVYALDTKDALLAGAPPLGRFLNPFVGFWQNCDPHDPTGSQVLRHPALRAEGRIQFDERLVPHLFASNDHDLYFLQGYITARLRLWQMETQVRAAGGRLAEVLGPKLLPLDRFNRRIGMRTAAETALRHMESDSASSAVLAAYCAGINAWIDELKPANYPFEYKLLDYAPEPWTPLQTALLLKYMAWDLTGRTQDAELTRVYGRYGRAVADDLFPNIPPLTDPVIPAGTPWNFKGLPLPKAPFRLLVSDSSFLACDSLWQNKPDAGNGSNNWAVGADRSATGYPLLANDPHLGLTLPSIWFEVQLVAPGINVYGVSLPGAPGVIIGYTPQLAWGVTNHGVDVLDWYRIHYTDAGRSEYLWGSEQRPVRTVVETLHVRGAETIFDTVRYTHHGPVVYESAEEGQRSFVPVGHALRWMAHEPSNELLAFYRLNRAQNYDEFQAALQLYDCPAQNFVYADTRKTIALHCTGRVPLRWPEQSRYLLDGSDPRADWQGYIPREHLPHVKNPPRGFVSSANQYPVDSTYPYPWPGFYASFERGRRINRRLDSLHSATVDSLRRLQLDEQNLLARSVLPALLKHTRREPLEPELRGWLAQLEGWNQRNAATSTAATRFHLWWHFIETGIWDDDFPPPLYPRPDAVRTALLIRQDTASRWYDDRSTPQRERLPQVLARALVQARDSLRRFSADSSQWAWGRFKGSYIPHLTRSASLRSFGRFDLNVGGGRDQINAMDVTHGPSWRMVVSLGPYVRGYGIYPGGQSGHPASRWYDAFVDRWAAGELDELLLLSQPAPSESRFLVGELLARPGN